jgi:HTH-type transcriptional regulator/antitoxin HipB
MKEDQLELVVRTPDQLGHALARYRKFRKITQREAGQKSGLRQATISKLEAGSGRIDTLTGVLGALGLELVVRERRTGTEVDLEDLF